jgi:hypothetical protein
VRRDPCELAVLDADVAHIDRRGVRSHDAHVLDQQVEGFLG